MHTASSETGNFRNLIWIGLVTVASVVLTGVYACALPLAALAAFAALDVERRDGLLLIGSVWLANQLLGFLALGYPHDFQAYAWGVAMLGATIVAYLAARQVLSTFAGSSKALAVVLGLVMAFAAYQILLYAATYVIGGGTDAFAMSIVQQLAIVNAISFAVLLIAHRILVAVGATPRNLIENRTAMSA